MSSFIKSGGKSNIGVIRNQIAESRSSSVSLFDTEGDGNWLGKNFIDFLLGMLFKTGAANPAECMNLAT